MSNPNANRDNNQSGQKQNPGSGQKQASNQLLAQSTASLPLKLHDVPPEFTPEKMATVKAKLPPPEVLNLTDEVLTTPNKTTTPGCVAMDTLEYKVTVADSGTTRAAVLGIVIVLGTVFVFTIGIMWALGLTVEILGAPVVKYPTALFVTLLCAIFGYGRWTRLVEAQTMKVYANMLSDNQMIVCPQGWGLLPGWYEPFEPMHVVKLREYMSFTAVFKLLTSDSITAHVTITGQYLPSRSSITAYLGFQPKTIVQQKLLTALEARYESAFSKHRYETLSQNRARLTSWSSNILGGDDEQSPFEVHLGITATIKQVDFTPAPESLALSQSMARARQFSEIIEMIKLTFPKASEGQVIWSAFRVMQEKGLIDTNSTINTAPGVKTIFMGGHDNVGGQVT